LFCKNYVRKFRSVTAANRKKIRNGSGNGNGNGETATEERQRNGGNQALHRGVNFEQTAGSPESRLGLGS